VGKIKLFSLNVLFNDALIIQHMEHRWNDTGSGYPMYSDKHCHNVTLYTANPLRIGPVSSPGHHSERPATESLSHSSV
jgi:hypothetical protein